MARNSRTVINRKALNALAGSFADAMGEMGQAVIDLTRPPDAEPFGEGLVTRGGWGVWAGTKKVAGEAQKPRAARMKRDTITLLVGYDFPARFQEVGTVHQPARPFLTPPAMAVLPRPEAPFRSAFRRIAGRFR